MKLHYILTETAYRKAYKYEKLKVSNIKPALVIDPPLGVTDEWKGSKGHFFFLA